MKETTKTIRIGTTICMPHHRRIALMWTKPPKTLQLPGRRLQKLVSMIWIKMLKANK
ncbi:hypothetical protein GDO78_015114 [Eleutherodactylus coqui]|uniref:Uncharacterized protein n=1 Tax=Eleutherodactylus coqui TaxID=57060 RepID=A0A8J6JPG1_ELECQ|nr:hypothetical protein GDO78_015114 [Eleutherodactylus coqui]